MTATLIISFLSMANAVLHKEAFTVSEVINLFKNCPTADQLNSRLHTKFSSKNVAIKGHMIGGYSMHLHVLPFKPSWLLSQFLW